MNDENRPLMLCDHGKLTKGMSREALLLGVRKVDDLLALETLKLPTRKKYMDLRKVLVTLHGQEIQEGSLLMQNKDLLLEMARHHQLIVSGYDPEAEDKRTGLSKEQREQLQVALLDWRERKKGVIDKNPNHEVMQFVAWKLGLRSEDGEVVALSHDHLAYIGWYWPKLLYI